MARQDNTPEEVETKVEKKATIKQLVAKKNFKLNAPPRLVLDIKKGDDLSGISGIDEFIINLKTEGVL